MTPGRWRLLRIGTGLLLLVLVLAAIDGPGLWAALAGADLRFVVLGVAGLTAIHIVPAAAWRAMVHQVSGARLGWGDTLRLSYAAQAIGGVTPANLGGDVLRVAAVRAAGHAWSATILPIVVQRATSYLALSILTIPAVVILASQSDVAAGMVLIGVVVAVIVAVAAGLLVAAPHHLRRLGRRLAPRMAPAPIEHPVPRRTLGIMALTGLFAGIAFHAGSLVLTWLLIAGVDRAIATLPILAALAIARLSLAVPLTPSGVGIQEAVVVTIVASLGAPVEAVLAGLLLGRLSLVSTTVIGAALAATTHGGLSGLRHGHMGRATRQQPLPRDLSR